MTFWSLDGGHTAVAQALNPRKTRAFFTTVLDVEDIDVDFLQDAFLAVRNDKVCCTHRRNAGR
jgi:hypothetical protein